MNTIERKNLLKLFCHYYIHLRCICNQLYVSDKLCAVEPKGVVSSNASSGRMQRCSGATHTCAARAAVFTLPVIIINYRTPHTALLLTIYTIYKVDTPEQHPIPVLLSRLQILSLSCKHVKKQHL